MYWMPKMHKTPIKARFIIASPNSSIKTLARTIASIFCLFFFENANIYSILSCYVLIKDQLFQR